MKYRTEIIVLIAAAAVLGALAYGREKAQERPPPSIFSAYDSGPNGYRALYDVLRRDGIPVRRFARVLGLLDNDVRTLIISGNENDLDPKGLDSHDAETLKRFVQDGGRLVVLDDSFVGTDDVTPGVGTTKTVSSRDAIALTDDRFTAGVERVAGPVGSVFPFSEHNATPLLANDSGVVAVAYKYGKGEVVAITAPALFGNANLQRGDNLAFAYNVIAGHGPVAFDEYVHGYDDDLSLWAALPKPVHAAIWIVGAIVAIALAAANVPFAPAIPADPPDERDSSAYIDAMAALMRRARAQRAAIGAFAGDARKRTRRVTNPAAVVAFARLEDLENKLNPGDDALVQAARLDYQLRKDLV